MYNPKKTSNANCGISIGDNMEFLTKPAPSLGK
jgi:hypothetical protein